MSGLEFLALTPYITITVGILVQMLAISFRRGHASAMVTGVLVLVATLAAVPIGLDAGPLGVT